MGTLSQVPVSERAIVARVNRALAKEGQALRKAREDSRWFDQTGRYFVVDLRGQGRGGLAVATHCDLQELAQELGVLNYFETIADRIEEASRIRIKDPLRDQRDRIEEVSRIGIKDPLRDRIEEASTDRIAAAFVDRVAEAARGHRGA